MSSRAVRICFLGLLALFALSRLHHLTLLPVFIDESLHIYWPPRLLEKGRFLHHLADGKSLQIWILHPVLRVASDPPWAARFVSVLVGGVGMWTAFEVGRRLYTAVAGLVAAALYTVSPFALFYDRMALADIYVSTFAALTLLASLRLTEAPTLGRSVALGLALTACVLSKMTGVVFFGVPLLAVWGLRPVAARVWRSLGASYALALALCAFPVLYFFRGFRVWAHLVGLVASWLGSQAPAHGHGHGKHDAEHLDVILDNLQTGAGWLWSYWTAPLLLLGAAGLVAALWKRDRAGLVLAFGALAPFAAFALVSRHWFARYLVCSVVPFAVLAGRLLAQAMESLKASRARLVAAPLLSLLAIPALRFDGLLLTDPLRAPLPADERFQYLEGWPSGYGTAEAARYLMDEAAKRPEGIRVVVHRGGERTIHLILRAYVMNAPRLELREEDLGDATTLATLQREARRLPTYVALAEPLTASQRLPEGAPLLAAADRVLSCHKPTGERVLEVYRLHAEGEVRD